MLMDNLGVHIAGAIDRTTCTKHDAPKGIPCWSLPKNVAGDLGHYASICGTRIKRAGFIGQISPQSMRGAASRQIISRKSTSQRSFNK